MPKASATWATSELSFQTATNCSRGDGEVLLLMEAKMAVPARIGKIFFWIIALTATPAFGYRWGMQAIDTENLRWVSGIGVSDLSNTCTKRRVWWILLDNGQAKQVADIRLTIKPSPTNRADQIMGWDYHVFDATGLAWPQETRLYTTAILQAGLWAGYVMGKDAQSLIEEVRRQLRRCAAN